MQNLILLLILVVDSFLLHIQRFILFFIFRFIVLNLKDFSAYTPQPYGVPQHQYPKPGLQPVGGFRQYSQGDGSNLNISPISPNDGQPQQVLQAPTKPQAAQRGAIPQQQQFQKPSPQPSPQIGSSQNSPTPGFFLKLNFQNLKF